MASILASFLLKVKSIFLKFINYIIMAITRHIEHIKSKVVENSNPKLPTASQIHEGEIAVNFAKGYETLSIKNSSGDVVTFLPRPYNSARGGETIHPIFDGTGTAGGTNLSAAWSGTSSDIVSLYDGLTILYKINSAGYASGDTLSINGGEAHKVILNASNALTTHYPVGSIVKLTYDSSVSGSFYTGSTTQKTTTGVWKIENYDSNTNTTHIYDTYYYGALYKAGADVYRYQLLLNKNETTLIPISNGNNTTANTKTITTSEFNPFAPIFYYNSTATTAANSAFASGVLNDGMTLNLTYSFNVASVLTTSKEVYLVAVPQTNGMAKLRNPSTTGVTSGPISQTLPTTDDGYIYIYLGAAYSTTSIFLSRVHPIYQFKDGKLIQYTGVEPSPWESGSGSNSAVLKGNDGYAEGVLSVAEGFGTFAYGNASHAEGRSTTAEGQYSHAEGTSVTAIGDSSHAEGNSTYAEGYYSHAEGSYTVTQNVSEHASGTYNISSKANTTFGNSGNTLFSVGNGRTSNYLHNAFEIRQNGDIYIVDTINGSGTTYDVKGMMKLQDRTLTTTEKTNIDALATNIAAISGITAAKVSAWDNPPTYCANVPLATTQNYIREPEFKTVKINGSTTNAASTENCVLQYDNDNKCVKFIFN